MWCWPVVFLLFPFECLFFYFYILTLPNLKKKTKTNEKVPELAPLFHCWLRGSLDPVWPLRPHRRRPRRRLKTAVDHPTTSGIALQLTRANPQWGCSWDDLLKDGVRRSPSLWCLKSVTHSHRVTQCEIVSATAAVVCYGDAKHKNIITVHILF